MILTSLDYAGCSGSSSSDVDIGHLTLDDGQLCPAELEQALQGDSLLLMACSAGYYQLAQVIYTDRVRSHSYEYESGYLYTGSSKHEFACIPMVAVHIDTSSVRVRVTCEFPSYEQFLYRPCFYPTHTM